MILLHFIICGTLLMCKIDLMVVLNVPFLIALGNEKVCNIKFYIKICYIISLRSDSMLFKKAFASIKHS
jgi:hypothetical protein